MNYEITKVTASPREGGWVYEAHWADGTTEELRRSMRPGKYPKAFLYSRKVTSGNKSGLRLFFTFGQRPSQYYRQHLVREFPIQ
jgi:hypothetical protein